jgi:hypothetical protein
VGNRVWDSFAVISFAVPLSGQQAKPAIAGFGERFETKPIGGYGLATS